MLDIQSFGRRSVRLVRQSEFSECGLAAIIMVANYHGIDIDLSTARRRYISSVRGATLRTLIKISDSIGLEARAVRAKLQDLDGIVLPCVVHWDLNHFVVLEEIKNNRYLIHDPNGTSSWLHIDELSTRYTGIALELRPAAFFTNTSGGPEDGLFDFRKIVSGLKSVIGQIAVLSLFMQAFAIGFPYLSQIAIDDVIPALDSNLLKSLAIAFGVLVVFNGVAALLRSYILLHAGTIIGYEMASSIVRHLFRLPVEWFARRHIGDILSRFQSVGPIQKALTETAVASVLDGTLALSTLTMMFIYSTPLALISTSFALVYIVLKLLTYGTLKSRQSDSIVAHGKEQTILIESVRGIETLRLYEQESLRHAYWKSRYIDAINADVRVARLSIMLSSSNIVIIGLENVVTLYFAVSYIISGSGFSIGMFVAFVSYKTQFIQRVSSFFDQGLSLLALQIHSDRLSDIVLSEEDKSTKSSILNNRGLEGSFRLERICYRYSDDDPYILYNLSFDVRSGESIAITGDSGCGKTTLFKIMLGLLYPCSGEIFVDEAELSRFGYSNYRRSIASVMQEDSLFTGSIYENITFFDESFHQEAVEVAAKTAHIHDEIMVMPMGYDTVIGDLGSTLSSGQKQRLYLARALLRKPTILFIDEGTAFLDEKNEAAINESLKRNGITKVCIAHRKETILAADRILYMRSGRLVEVERSEIGLELEKPAQ